MNEDEILEEIRDIAARAEAFSSSRYHGQGYGMEWQEADIPRSIELVAEAIQKLVKYLKKEKQSDGI